MRGEPNHRFLCRHNNPIVNEKLFHDVINSIFRVKCGFSKVRIYHFCRNSEEGR